MDERATEALRQRPSIFGSVETERIEGISFKEQQTNEPAEETQDDSPVQNLGMAGQMALRRSNFSSNQQTPMAVKETPGNKHEPVKHMLSRAITILSSISNTLLTQKAEAKDAREAQDRANRENRIESKQHAVRANQKEKEVEKKDAEIGRLMALLAKAGIKHE